MLGKVPFDLVLEGLLVLFILLGFVNGSEGLRVEESCDQVIILCFRQDVGCLLKWFNPLGEYSNLIFLHSYVLVTIGTTEELIALLLDFG